MLDHQEVINIVLKEVAHQKPEEVCFFFDFLKSFKVDSIVEIGTGNGGMASLFKIYFPEARVISIDLYPCDEAKGKAEKHGFEYIIGNSHSEETVKKVIDMVGKIDLLFIDGDHDYNGIKKDFELWGKHAKVIAFHDIVWNCGKVGMSTATVWKFWNELREKYKPDNVREIICSAYGGLVEHSGIGVIWQTE